MTFPPDRQLRLLDLPTEVLLKVRLLPLSPRLRRGAQKLISSERCQVLCNLSAKDLLRTTLVASPFHRLVRYER